MARDPSPLRRVVTGYDSSGKSVFVEDGPAHAKTSANRPGFRSYHPWTTGKLPVPVSDQDRSSELKSILAAHPLPGGALLNIVDLPSEPSDPAEREKFLADYRERIRAGGVNPEHGVRRFPDGPHPGMHETDTVDYAIVLSGEIYAILEGEERLLKQGDVLIQRGTNHAWSNRSGEYCRMAFFLVDASR